MDIYRPYFNPGASQGQMVRVGRLTALFALVIAAVIAPQLGTLGQAFQFIQEYTGVVSPGILAVFLTGLFWKPTTNRAAIYGILVSIPLALFFKVAPNEWSTLWIFPELPFMHQMMITCLGTIAFIIVFSQFEGKGQPNEKAIDVNRALFSTSRVFNICAFYRIHYLRFPLRIFLVIPRKTMCP